MTLDNLIYGYFKASFPELYHTSDGYYRFNNPFGIKKDKSSAVNFDYNVVMDMRSGYKSSTLEFIQLLERLPNIKAVFDFLDFQIVPIEKPIIEVSKNTENTVIPSSYLLYDGDTIFKDLVHNYINSRGFDVDFLVKKQCRYCTEGDFYGRLLLPYLNEKSEWLTFTGRDFIGNQEPKYKNPKNGTTQIPMRSALYNKHFLDTSDKVYINEGIIDALTWEYKGYKAIATGGWAISREKIELFLKSPVKEFIIVSDRGFYKKTLNQFSFLLAIDKPFKVINMDLCLFKDANEGGINPILEMEEKTAYADYSMLFCDE